MNKLMKSQLDMLNTLEHTVDGQLTKDIPESFSQITFYKIGNTRALAYPKIKIFIFEDYIIKPFQGFDFHDKFNKGNPPPFKVMTGEILKETDKMYYLTCKAIIATTKYCVHCLKPQVVKYLCNDCSKLYKNIESIVWVGWIPKKSVKIMEK